MMEGHRPTRGDRDTGVHGKAQSSMYGVGGNSAQGLRSLP